MTKSILAKQDDGTLQLKLTVSQDAIKKARAEVIKEYAAQADLPGFRKGKAPEKLIEEKINQDTLREEILKKILPQIYMDAIEEHKLKPIMNPKLHVEKIEDGADWIVNALTCELPEVALGKYQENVKKLTAKSKIIVPGKENEQKKPTTEEILKAVLESATVKVPGILVEQEADRLISQLLDDIKKLGLSLDQYLASTKRNPQDLRAEYASRAENDIKLEFVLQKIAEDAKISVDPKEIEEAIEKAQNPEERKSMEANRYLLAGILRQQKTLDFLMNL
jgi:FKBP-type peptidyl-prolyl cis-trans isomerase (trigger factor)